MANFVASIKRGANVVGLTLSTMFEKPKLFLFPIIVTLVSFISITLFVHVTIGIQELLVLIKQAIEEGQASHALKTEVAVVFTAGFFFLGFVITLCESILAIATSYATFDIINNRPVRFFASLKHGFFNIWVSIKWSLVSMVVITILSKKNKTGPKALRFLVDLLQGLGKIAWKVATFFIIPIITLEHVGVIDAIKKSVHTMKQTFGESATGAVFLGFVASAISFVLLLTSVVILFLAKSYLGTVSGIGFALGLLLLQFLFSIALYETIATIFKTVVYCYATGRPTGKFSRDLIEESFGEK